MLVNAGAPDGPCRGEQPHSARSDRARDDSTPGRRTPGRWPRRGRDRAAA